MMNVRTRLAASHGIIIALTLLVAPLALYAVWHLVGRIDTISSRHLRAIESTERISQSQGAEIRDLLAEIASPGSTPDAPPQTFPTAVQNAIVEARPFYQTPEQRALLDTFEQKYQSFEDALATWRTDKTAHRDDVKNLAVYFGELREEIVRMREMQNASLAASAMATRDFARAMLTLLIAFILLALFIGLLATIRSVRAVAEPVEQLTALVRKMSEEDFDIAYKPGAISDFNVLGHHFETMGHALRLFRATNMERIIFEQRRSDAVLDSIGDGLVIFSEQGLIERINPVAERQLGLEAGDGIGQRFEDIGDATAGQRVRELLDRGELSGTAPPEIQIDSGGDHRVLAYSLQRFVEGESGRAGVVMVMRDVTIQREFDKMRNEFVLRASHELRTPIASVRMGLGLLGEKFNFAPGSRDLELYETVQTELQRMVNLLTDLLDLSRLRVGEHVLEREPTDVGQVLSEAKQRFDIAATTNGIRISVELAPSLPRVSLCRNAMDRVLDNLIANAMRHTPAGGSITLTTERLPQHVQISVADTGEGIASNQQAMIFQPFVQIGKKRGGAGLGLAICREIINQHGGEISVSSQLRRGTTFSIRLPE